MGSGRCSKTSTQRMASNDPAGSGIDVMSETISMFDVSRTRIQNAGLCRKGGQYFIKPDIATRLVNRRKVNYGIRFGFPKAGKSLAENIHSVSLLQLLLGFLKPETTTGIVLLVRHGRIARR